MTQCRFHRGTSCRRIAKESADVGEQTVTSARFLRTLFQAVLSYAIGRAGSVVRRLPPGNTNHSPAGIPKALLVAQGDHRVDTRGAAGGDIAGEAGHDRQGDGRERDG